MCPCCWPLDANVAGVECTGDGTAAQGGSVFAGSQFTLNATSPSASGSASTSSFDTLPLPYCHCSFVEVLLMCDSILVWCAVRRLMVYTGTLLMDPSFLNVSDMPAKSSASARVPPRVLPSQYHLKWSWYVVAQAGYIAAS